MKHKLEKFIESLKTENTKNVLLKVNIEDFGWLRKFKKEHGFTWVQMFKVMRFVLEETLE